ncbi:dihydropyrimidinase 2-like [Nymphalis io]|uniref:dihydropyrimidinase 2-like n=1 Tax=Inachis io TaxID=171585 RepID=UPI0021697D6F|nr:dihydropyrimidinase 2-like [Nymphalis io]XP_050357214.1 dihydropyrimidinase 2-like [Nymphalis io]
MLVFHLWPRKGRVAAGADADLALWDPRRERTVSAHTHHHAVDFNIFEGQHVIGSPQYVIVNGRVCLDDGELRVVEGFGKFLNTPPDSPTVYGARNEQQASDVSDGGRESPRASPAYTNGTSTELSISNKQMEGLSVSGCSTPTGRKMREPGQRDLQNSTFSITLLIV